VPRVVALWILVLAACGDNAAPDEDGARSGTRLKITDWVFEDGTRQWDDFYDTQRHEHCDFNWEPWTDGYIYCVPSATAAVHYADAACTQPVITDAPDVATGAPPAYGLVLEGGPCGFQTFTPSHLYARGNKLTLTRYFGWDSDGRCVASGPTMGEAFYAVGPEVPTTELVQAQLGPPEGSARLAARYLTATDGTQFPYTLHDAVLDSDCDYRGINTAPKMDCGPVPSAWAGYADDASCTTPVAALIPGCTAPPYAVFFPDVCPLAGEYYAIDAQEASSPIYEGLGTSFQRATPDRSMHYVTASRRLALASVDRAHEQRPGRRVQRIYATTPGRATVA
jgi:hypothetical protein